MSIEPLTPREKKQKLKERLAAVLPLLPDKWSNLFIHLYPAYAGRESHLYNVKNGLSLDEAVIERMEEIAAGLKNITKKPE